MRHLNDGVLRRSIDEPFAIADSQRAHLASCEKCQVKLAATVADSRVVQGVLASPPLVVHSSAARERFKRQMPPVPARRRWLPARRPRPGTGRKVGGVAAVLAAFSVVTFTPAGSLAQSFVTIFQPSAVTAIPLTSLDVRSLAQLQNYGSLHLPPQVANQTVSTAQRAADLSGMDVLTPASLPAGVPTSVSYSVSPGATASFTFSASKASAWAESHGKTLPPMPARLNGSVTNLTVGAAVVTMYGGCTVKCSTIPPLVIGQTVAPRLTSSRATLTEIEDYVFALPGVSPQLATELRSLGDPTSALPIPIPTAFVHASSVQIQGVKGEEMGDQTGVGSLVVWEKDGIIYAVGGPLPVSQVESIANGLH